MTMNTTPPPPEPLGTITDRLLAMAAKRSEVFAFQIQAAARQRNCPTCDHLSTLNEDESLTAGKLVYRCESCAAVQAETAKRDHWRKSGIPVDVHHATFDNFDTTGIPALASDSQTKFLRAAKEFDTGTVRNLIMAGTPGIGKGHLAAAIAKTRIERFYRYAVQWWVMHKLFEASHRAYEDGNRQMMIDRLVDVPLLILDEIALAPPPADGERFLYDIINGRQQNRRQTIFLSNKAAEQIRNWLGPATTDRLRSGGVRFLWGDWPSARGSKIEGGGF